VYLFYLISSITVYTIIPRASGKTKFIMHATVIAVLSNIALSLWLVSMFGPIGAAVATIISSILMASCLLLLSCRILGVSFSRIFPWSHLAKLLLVSLIASLPIYVVGYFYHPEGMKLLLLILMDTVIYLYCCVFLLMRLGLIYSDDMDLLKKWLRFDVKRWLSKLTFSG
ncbi:MAG: polysaccharide biosynthesis C-terminal domain-containing protein, partial [Patescibacteria group bacterium]|nr:polysaccharide biosynthesis C-terminal domain-containing protein [Patescibacteria group bacterium]